MPTLTVVPEVEEAIEELKVNPVEPEAKLPRPIWEEPALQLYNLPWFEGGAEADKARAFSVAMLWPHVAAPEDAGKGLVQYYPSIQALLAGKASVIKLGKLIAKRWSWISSDEVRDLVDAYKVEFGPAQLEIIHDADGIVEAYEASYGFTSCMMLDHPRRYLDDIFDKANHPVRLYAAEVTQAVALAVLRDSQGRVKARSLVRLDDKAGYIRLYGEEGRLLRELQRVGLGVRTTLEGLRFPMEMDNEHIICPYLDNPRWFDVEDGCIVPSRTGEFEVVSCGLVRFFPCPVCGAPVSRTDTMCLACEDAYVFAWGQGGRWVPILREDAVEYEGELYDSWAISEYGLAYCERCGELMPSHKLRWYDEEGYVCTTCNT